MQITTVHGFLDEGPELRNV